MERLNQRIEDLNIILTRLEEKILLAIKTQDVTAETLNEIMNNASETHARLKVIESQNMDESIKNITIILASVENRLSKLEEKENKNENRWSQIVSFITQLVWTLTACGILYKLGWNSLPTP